MTKVRASILMCLAAVAVVALSGAAAPVALAQSSDLGPLLDRIQRLERDIRTLNLQISRGGSGAGSSGAPAPLVSGDTTPTGTAGIARLDARISALESDLRSMTGQIEEIAHQVRGVNDRLDKLVSDVDFRLRQVEQRGAAAGVPPSGPPSIAAAPSPPAVQSARPGEAPPPAQPGTLGTLTKTELESYAARPPAEAAPSAPVEAPKPETGPLPPGTPREQYTFAFDLLRKAKYGEAETALQAFVERHPDEPLTANARYWLGETFYVRGDYARAAEVFLDGYQKHRNGPKAPDSLLKLGMSLANLDKKQEACATFDEIAKAFPELSSRVRDRVARERQRTGCP